jgi:LPS O-antigen subunit length determinant protein (WzzB/FepE family)
MEKRMSTIQEQYQDDEIDLRELFKTLWKNKLLIFIITIIFSIAGILYVFFAPKVWSAKAVIIEPSSTDLEQLQNRIDRLDALIDISTKNRNTNDNKIINDIRIINDNRNTNDNQATEYKDFFETFSEATLYKDFIQAYNSFDNKSEFLNTKVYVQKEDKVKNISVNKKSNEKFATLSLSSDNAQKAGRLLNEYIDFIQAKEVLAKNQLLVDKVTSQTNVLTLNHQILKAETLQRLKEEIIRTQYALRISRTVGIEAPVENLNNQSIFAIDLGAKALAEKLNVLKEIENPEFMNPVLADIRLRLDSLQAIPQEKVIFTSYQFLQSPSEPLYRDKPKRSLVIILAVFAGLMTGTIVVLLRAGSLFIKCRRD